MGWSDPAAPPAAPAAAPAAGFSISSDNPLAYWLARPGLAVLTVTLPAPQGGVRSVAFEGLSWLSVLHCLNEMGVIGRSP